MLVFIPGRCRRRRVGVTDAVLRLIPADVRDHSRDWKALGQEPPFAKTAGKAYIVRYVMFGDGRRATEILAIDGNWYEVAEYAVIPDVCLFKPMEW